MINWITENGLALYGAVAGTIALLISYFGHRHNIERDRIKLSVDFSPHPDQTKNVEKLRIPKEDQNSFLAGPIYQVEYYVVTVRNIGAVPAPISDVWVKSVDGKIHSSLISVRLGTHSILQKLSETSIDPIEPNSCVKFSIYLRRGESEFKAISAYATDQTGKEWRSRA